MLWKPRKIPLLLAGMWPATEGDPESGARILIQDHVGGTELLSGFSDTLGQFRGQLSAERAGEDVRIVIVEPSFVFDDYNSVKVNRWGLFLAVRQQKDLNFNGSKSAKTIDPERWTKWNSNEEHARASEITHTAARTAKLAWPVGFVGLAVAVLLGVAGFFIHPIVGLLAGVAVAWGSDFLSRDLLTRGY